MTTQTAPIDNRVGAGAPLSRFIQCRAPAALYEWMRLPGDSIDSIVLGAVAAYRIELDARGGAPRHAMRDGGPQVTYNVRLDTTTYAWLRTTAAHAGASINALVGAALIQAQADQGRKAAATNA